MTVEDDLDAVRGDCKSDRATLDLQDTAANAYRTMLQEIGKMERAQTASTPETPGSIEQQASQVLQKFTTLRTVLEAAHSDFLNWSQEG